MTTSHTVTVSEIPVSRDDPTQAAWGVPLASQTVFAIAHGSAAAETFDAADLSDATRTLMAAYGRGVSVALGGGGDSAVGSAWGDVFRSGDGVNFIDGGANGGTAPDGNPARDVLNVFAASAAAVEALAVVALDAGAGGADGAAYAAGYRVKVVNGDEVDYLKDVEQVNVFRADAGNAYVKTIRLALEVRGLGAGDPGLDANLHYAWAEGTDGADSFDAAALPAATLALMDQRGRGVYVALGAGDDTAVGSGHGDDFTMGAGTNWVDGGANAGTTPWGGKPQDVLHVVVADAAAAAAVRVTALAAGMDDPDAQAFAAGYTYKVTAGAETDYVKNIERVAVQVALAYGGSSFVRDIALALIVDEAGPRDPALGSYAQLAWIHGTAGGDVIEDGGADLLSAGIRAAMATRGKGVWIDGGAGDDVIEGSAYADNIVAGAGTNRVDGGAAADVLALYVATRAEADAVSVTVLDARATGADAEAWAAGYLYKVANGSVEVDYVKNIERVEVWVWTDRDGDGVRDYAGADDPANELAFARSIDLGTNTAPTFAGVPAGVAIDGSGANVLQTGAVVLADGRLLALRSILGADGSYSHVLVRSNADGGVDTTFGAGSGRVALPIGAVPNTDPLPLPDGKLLVAVSTPGAGADFQVLRLNADGGVDTSYGSNGAVVVAASANNDIPLKLLRQPDGKVVVVGYDYQVVNGSQVSDFAVAVRLNADGALDTGFGAGGRLLVSQAGAGAMSDATLQADGKLLVSGYLGGASSLEMALARFNADGSPDTAFGNGGRVMLDLGPGTDNGRSVVVLADGRILVGGTTRSANNDVDGALVRLNADGSLDATFGSGGIVRAHLSDGHDVFSQVAVQADGKVVVLGTIGAGQAGNAIGGDLMLARYNADGSVDASFGTDGVLRIPGHGIGVGQDPAGLFLVDGKIVVFATTLEDIGGTTSALVARVNADGTLDATFNPAPASSIGGGVRMNGVQAAVLDGNGAIHDAELAARGNYGGATLVLERQGGASADDLFVALGETSFANGRLSVGGTVIGTAGQSGGTLSIVFDANASQGLVNRALHGIGYANGSATPPADVTIDWIFADGSGGAGGPLTARASTTVTFGPTVQSANADNAASYDFVSVVTGSARADAIDAGLFSAAELALMAARGRGASYDMRGGGGDTVAGTGYSDLFVMGAGTNWVDGGAQAGSYPYGGNGMDELNVYVQGQAPAASVTRLDAGATGLDAQAHAQGYAFKVVNGAEVDYVKNVERLQVYRWNDANGNGVRDAGETTWLAEHVLAQFVREVRAGSQPGRDAAGNLLASYANIAWAYGSDLGERFDAAVDVSAATRALMDQAQRGVAVYAGAGDDTIAGSAHGDEIEGGAGTNWIDGGANAGTMPNGREAARDQLNVYVADDAAAAAVRAVLLEAGATGTDADAYAQGYTHKVVNGAETDYVKDVERLVVWKWSDTDGDGAHGPREAGQYVRELALRLYVNEIGLGAAPGTDGNGQPLANAVHMAWAYGGAGADRFDAATDVSPATLALMARYGRGIWGELGAGDDRATGSAWGDNVSLGKGVNRYDGGANDGLAPDGAPAEDVLEVDVASRAEADAVAVTRLAAGMAGEDAVAYAEGYAYKVTAAGEVDYLRNVERVSINIWTDKDGDGMRDYAAPDDPRNEVVFERGCVLAEEAANRTPTFGAPAGVAMVDRGYDFTPTALLRLDDGKLLSLGVMNPLADGYAYVNVLARNNADGGIDTAFGDGGMLVLPATLGRSGRIALQADGKLLVAYASEVGAGAAADITVVRYHPDGSVDAAFGQQGTVTLHLGTGYASPVALLAGAGGDILLATGKYVVRLDADGGLDTGFDGDGMLALAQGAGTLAVSAAALQQDGKLVLAGATGPAGSQSIGVVRIGADGGLDGTFGSGGSVAVGFDGSAGAAGLELLDDGSILVAGNVTQGTGRDKALVKLGADGSLDAGFGANGKVIQPDGTPDRAYAMAVQDDGRIVLAGERDGRIEVVRYLADGSVDAGFGAGGTVLLAVRGLRDYAVAVALDGDGIVVMSPSYFNANADSSLVLARLDADGSLDAGFGPGQDSSLGGSVRYDGVDPVVLDRNVTIYDADLVARGHFGGAVLTVARQGGADGGDLFSAAGEVSFAGGRLRVDGQAIGTVVQSGGTLALAFDAQATQALVNRALHGIAWSHAGAQQGTVAVEWRFSDDGSNVAGHVASGIVTIEVDGPAPSGTGFDGALRLAVATGAWADNSALLEVQAWNGREQDGAAGYAGAQGGIDTIPRGFDPFTQDVVLVGMALAPLAPA